MAYPVMNAADINAALGNRLPIDTDDFYVFDGVTDNQPQWQAALNAAATTGRPLRYRTTLLNSAVAVARQTIITDPKALTIFPAPGARIYYGPKNNILTVKHSIVGSMTVTAVQSVEFPAGTGQFVTRVDVETVSSAVAVDSVVKIYSDDTYQYGPDTLNTQKAQQDTVLWIDRDNKYIYLRGLLFDTYPTSPRLVVYGAGRHYENGAIVEGSKVEAEINFSAWETADVNIDDTRDENDPTAIRVNVAVRNAVSQEQGVGGKFILTGERAWGSLLGLYSCHATERTINYDKIRNFPTLGCYGYGAEDSGSTRYIRDLFSRVSSARHKDSTVMRNSVANGELHKAGRQADGRIINGEAINMASAGFDVHEGAFRYSFEGCKARSPVLDANAIASGMVGTDRGIQDRGEATSIINFQYEGRGLAMVLLSKAFNYGRAYETRIINPLITVPPEYRAAYPSNGPAISFTGIDAANTDQQRVTVLGGAISGITQLLDWGTLASNVSTPYGQNLEVYLGGGLLLNDVTTIEAHNSTTQVLIMDGVKRKQSSGTIQPILAYQNAAPLILDYEVIATGTATFTSMVRGQGGGSARPILGDLRTNLQGSNQVRFDTAVANTGFPTYTKDQSQTAIASVTVPALAAGATGTADVTMSGLLLVYQANTRVDAKFSAAPPAGTVIDAAWLQANNTARIQFRNVTAGALSAQSGVAMTLEARRAW